MRNNTTLSHIFFFLFSTAAVILISYIAISNIAPWGMSLSESMGDETNTIISELGPVDRVEKVTKDGDISYIQKDDILYFGTELPFEFDTATITLTYRNPSIEQELYLGFKDNSDWHYNTKIIDAPLLNDLKQSPIGTDYLLYQKADTYTSVEQFLKSPPRDKIIGLYGVEPDVLGNKGLEIPNYKKNESTTTISPKLRGTHTFFVYLENEPFTMKIEKQDLNLIKGKDSANIKVYKENDVVFESTISDDGLADDSGETSKPQTTLIENPGPGLPENGVYKIKITANQDVIINKITTNLHKIVFSDHIFLANNSIYSPVVPSTNPTKLFTNSHVISAITYHPQGLQTIRYDNTPVRVNKIQEYFIASSSAQMSELIVPKNDVILEGIFGFFAFDKNHFFNPQPYMIVPITKDMEMQDFDYLLTSYKPPLKYNNNWKQAKITFDLMNAYIENNRLSWIIKSPGLKQSGNQIVINDITITLSKKPIL